MSAETYQKVKGTMFKKSNIPKNHREVGSERITVDGYVEIKVAEPNKWKFKSRVLYEQYHDVKLTRNDVIIFLDGNKLNLDVDNLFLISRAALARFNQDKFYSDNPEITKAAALMAELKTETRKKRSEVRRMLVMDFNGKAIKTDLMIDLVKFREEEPDLYAELAADYPATEKNYVISVSKDEDKKCEE